MKMRASSSLQAGFLAAWVAWAGGCSGDAPTGSAADANAPDASDASGADTGVGVDTSVDTSVDASVDTSVGADTGTGTDTGAAGDTGAEVSSDAGPRCDPTKPFANVRLMAGLNDAGSSNEGARLSPDELTAYFTRFATETGTTADVYVATRTSRSAPFSGAAPLAGGNTANNDRWPTVTADARFMYVWNGPKTNTLVASRATTSDAFSSFTIVPELVVPTASNNEEPYILPDHSAIYLAANPTTSGATYDLYRSTRTTGSFLPPAPVPGVNTSSDELFPLVSADELTIYFASNRPGAAGRYDIYRATRANTSTAFGAAEQVTPLNSIGADLPSWASADDCVMLFTSDRNGTYGIFIAERGK